MNSLDATLIGFIAMTAIASVTPGPAVLAVCGTAIGSGTRPALSQIIGTQIGNVLYALVAVLGVKALLAADPRLFAGMQLFGAGYLFWLGLQAIRSARSLQVSGHNSSLNAQTLSTATAIQRGFMVQVVNPKTMLYWFALLPPFLPSDESNMSRALMLVVIGMLIDAFAMAGYVQLIAKARTLLSSNHAAVRFQQASGAVYVAAGLLLGVRALR
jgi:threonine/homoserine/homoserine lactone efflux protein